MDLISDLFLIAGALSAGFYCFVLSRRLSAFTDAESGIGQVVHSLSKQVDDLNRSIHSAREEAGASNTALKDLTSRAEGVAKRLELMVASMHDIPSPQAPKPSKRDAVQERPIFSTRMNFERETLND